ncbi:MAG: hypothetical protein ACRC57_00510 [Sarcina sp.]
MENIVKLIKMEYSNYIQNHNGNKDHLFFILEKVKKEIEKELEILNMDKKQKAKYEILEIEKDIELLYKQIEDLNKYKKVKETIFEI